MNDHVPVPTSALERLLEREKAVGGRFSHEMALTHMMLDWVTGRVRSRQEYADVWMWSKSTVNRAMPALYDEAERLLSFRAAALVEDEDEEPSSMADLFPGMPKAPPTKPQSSRDRRLLNRPFFEKDTWQYSFAVAFTGKMQSEGVSTRQFKDQPSVAIQDYARTFDELNRLDGHSKETIVKVMRYLFNEDDFWIRSGNLQSASQLRRKKNTNGEYVFDQLLHKMNRSGRSGAGRQDDYRTRIGSIHETAKRAREVLNSGA